jgi:carbonic anhydrase
MHRLVKVNHENDIFPHLQGSPVGELLAYHNLGKKFTGYSTPQLLVGMCMDHRVKLNIPQKFAYVIRTGGSNPLNGDFGISYAIGVGGIQHFAFICHNNCGMANVTAKKDKFVKGLISNAGWVKEQAEEHFDHHAPLFEIGHEVDFVLTEASRLQQRYPGIHVEPLFYVVEDSRLYQVGPR